MVDLEFPDGALEMGFELAFGADIDGDQDLWVWTDLSPVFMSQTVSVSRGRQNESSDVAPTAAGVVVDNPDGDLTPDNAVSPYYPYVDLGTPARWWIQASTPRLYLRPANGSAASVASSAALNLTNDLDVRIDMHLKTMSPDGTPAAIAGRADTLSTFSWRVLVYPDRTVKLQWSPTGGAPILSVTSATPVLPMSSRTTLRVTLDVNNGAGGRTATFYVGDSVSGSFTQVGPTVVQAGTTSINNAAQPLIVGDTTDLTASYAPDANVYAFQLLNGIGGSALANADFTAQTSGATSFVDTAGRTWNISTPAELSNRWFRIVGTGDEWAPTWPWGDLSEEIPGGVDEGEARVDIAIAGILRRLGQGAKPLDSALRRAISTYPRVLAYWPMEDEDSATSAASAIPGRPPLTVGAAFDFAADSTLPGSKPLPKFTATSGISGSVTGIFGGNVQTDWYINASAGPASPTIIMTMAMSPGATVALWVVLISAGAVTVTGYSPTNVVVSTVSGTPTGLYGGWTHLTLLVTQQGSTVTMTLTWTPVTFPASAPLSITSSFAGVVGNPTTLATPASALLAGISIGHLSAASLAGSDIARNAATGWRGEAAAERIRRLCAEQGVRFRVIGEPSTTTKMGSQQVATFLTLLDDAQEVDGGILYEMPDAVGLVYRTRESMYNQPPNLILDAHLNQMANPFAPIRDDQRLRNDITVTRSGGSSFQAINAASVAERGTYPDTPTLNLLDDTLLADAAGWRLHQGVVPGMRYPSITLNLGVSPEVIDDWLTVDQGAQVHAINLPPQHPIGTVKTVAEGYSEPISPFTWDPTLNCSPASVWDVAIVDGTGVTDAYLLRLETDGSQLAEAINAVVTTFKVAVIAGPNWVTAPAEFPFDIAIGGEQMTVSDIDADTGGAMFTAAGAAGTVATTTHTAPSVVAPAVGDLLVCTWESFAIPGTYSIPVGMVGDPATSGTFSTLKTARQTLVAAGATGSRTAILSSADKYAATSLVVHAGTGSPVIVDYVSGISGTALTLTTSVAAAPGDWLVVINGWDWDPGDAMAPPGPEWMEVTDSGALGTATSRISIWARRILTAGAYSVTLPIGGGVTDNHGRLFTIRGLTGPTQLFTVTRSVNGIVKSHGITANVTLWNQPVLAR